jgi:enoyl-CoA hydratase/carnithine racemase
LTQLCGAGVARRLILGAETVSGVEAVALGLAHWSHPADQLMEAGIALAARIAALSGSATAACKHCIAAALDPRADGYAAELDASAALLAGADAQNRVHRFLKARS